MQSLAQRYSAITHRKYARTGSMWDGRFRAFAVESDAYVLACYRYIELNPVRACLADRAESYRWSSHHAKDGFVRSDWLVPHPTYLALRTSQRSAAESYREVFAIPLDDAVLADLRAGLGQPPVSDTVSDTGVSR